MKISVTIITHNEENNIARAINSVAFADEVIVVDSHSQDRTRDIASELGAKVFENKWPGYGAQKNYAATLCQNNWILSIDADEEVTTSLQQEIIALKEDDSVDQYLINRLTYFCGRPIKNGGWFPDWIGRLYHKQRCKWTDSEVHEELISTSGGVSVNLLGLINHYSFNTVLDQVHTNVKYANLGAQKLIKKRRPGLLSVLFRPFWKFIECYFLKLGVLDGKEGLIIALNASYSMFMKYSIAYMDKSND